MTEYILKQCRVIKQEIEDLQSKIDELNIERNIMVTDKVTGSSKDFPYTKKNFTIIGLDIETMERKEKRIVILNKIREERRLILLETETQIEEFLLEIDDSRVRQMFRLIFIDGKSQDAAGKKLGFHRSTVSKTIKKYLEKQ